MKRSYTKPHSKATRQQSDSRADLLARAKRLGVRGRHRMTKAELIRALESYRKKKAQKPIKTKTAKSAAVSFGGSKRSRYDDLPWSYGKTELVLMPVSPFLLYAYWDFSLKDWEPLRHRREPIVLRIYDITMIKFDGTNAHHHSDIPVFLKAQNWYVPIWSAEKSLCADLGCLLPDGTFQPIVRSNVITTPRAGVSILEKSRWVEIRPDGRRITKPGLLRNPGSKKQSRQTLWKKLEQQAASLTSGNITGLSSQRQPPII